VGFGGGLLGRWSFGMWIALDGRSFACIFAFVSSWVWMMVFEVRRLHADWSSTFCEFVGFYLHGWTGKDSMTYNSR